MIRRDALVDHAFAAVFGDTLVGRYPLPVPGHTVHATFAVPVPTHKHDSGAMRDYAVQCDAYASKAFGVLYPTCWALCDMELRMFFLPAHATPYERDARATFVANARVVFTAMALATTKACPIVSTPRDAGVFSFVSPPTETFEGLAPSVITRISAAQIAKQIGCAATICKERFVVHITCAALVAIVNELSAHPTRASIVASDLSRAVVEMIDNDTLACCPRMVMIGAMIVMYKPEEHAEPLAVREWTDALTRMLWGYVTTLSFVATDSAVDL